MKKLIRVLLNLYTLAAAELLTVANAIYAGLNLNPAYPTPPIAMPDFRLAIDNFAAALTAALDGGTKAIAERTAKGEALKRMIRVLAHYVEANCKDDMPTFLSSGFQAAANARTKPLPVSEAIRKIAPGPKTGELVVSLVKVPGAGSYELRWATVASGGSPGEWLTGQFLRTGPFTVNGLTPGATYAFQTRAVTANGVTNWSESVTRICT